MTKQRRTYAEIFMDTLSDMSDGEPELIGNKALRNELGWDEDRYERIKEQLVDERLIITGKGQGGSVGLAYADDSEALNLFVSYSRLWPI